MKGAFESQFVTTIKIFDEQIKQIQEIVSRNQKIGFKILFKVQDMVKTALSELDEKLQLKTYLTDDYCPA